MIARGFPKNQFVGSPDRLPPNYKTAVIASIERKNSRISLTITAVDYRNGKYHLKERLQFAVDNFIGKTEPLPWLYWSIMELPLC